MASAKVAVRVRPFNKRELAMNAKMIIQMDGKKTRFSTLRHQEAVRKSIEKNTKTSHLITLIDPATQMTIIMHPEKRSSTILVRM